MPVVETAEFRPLNDREFAKFRQLAYDTFGLNLPVGKQALVAARLAKHLRRTGCRTFDEYYRRVTEDTTGESLTELIDALTTNHTSFFREPAHFEFLRSVLLPQWKNRTSIDIWSAACSTGEEPYSIAMCVLEELGAAVSGRVCILATDISTRVLAKAERGVYPAERFEDFPALRLRQFWLRGDGEWAGWYRAKTELRAVVSFRRLNLLDALARFGTYPLIFCRNVMIYFDKPTQQQVVGRLTESLEPGGYLFIGHAEGLGGVVHGLEYVCPAVYRKPQPGERRKGRR